MGGSFDSATYLRGLGWQGPGSSLNGAAHGRAKPVTVVQKKTLSGIGKDRDTSFQWWDAIFTSVASKVGGETGGKVEQRTTSTGILSHRPPPKQGNAYDPSTSASSSSRLNLDAMAAAKIEYARRQLYSGFLRGSTLKPDEEAASLAGLKNDGKENAAPGSSGAAASSSSKKRKRDDGDEDEESRRKAEKKEKKERKRREKEEKRAKKEAKRAAKAAKEKGKAKEEVVAVSSSTAATTTQGGDLILVEDLDVSTTTTPPAEPSPSSSKPSKEERRAAKALRKGLAVAGATSPAAVASLARDHLSPEEELAADEAGYAEAKAAAKRAAKEEKRLAKMVKRALEEQAKA
ncbi:hypothetical protein JCM10213_001111 [Rhodosporidiobolus nylandii]